LPSIIVIFIAILLPSCTFPAGAGVVTDNHGGTGGNPCDGAATRSDCDEWPKGTEIILNGTDGDRRLVLAARARLTVLEPGQDVSPDWEFGFCATSDGGLCTGDPSEWVVVQAVVPTGATGISGEYILGDMENSRDPVSNVQALVEGIESFSRSGRISVENLSGERFAGSLHAQMVSHDDRSTISEISATFRGRWAIDCWNILVGEKDWSRDTELKSEFCLPFRNWVSD